MLKLMEDSQLRAPWVAGRERASKHFSNQVASAHLAFLQGLGNPEIK